MEMFTSLKSLQNHIESKSLDFKYPHNISSLFQKFRDRAISLNRTLVSTKAQWEMDFFNFIIVKGECKPQWSGVNKQNEEVEYPDFKNFTEHTYRYIDNRLNVTENPLLRARYSSILWNSPRKHINYAKIAIESNLVLIQLYENRDLNDPDGIHGHDLLQTIESAFYISIRAKYKIHETKSEVLRLINKFNRKSTWSFRIRASLIDLIIDRPKNFKDSEIEGTDKLCWDISDDMVKNNDYFRAIDILERGEKVSRRIKTSQYDWTLQIAKYQEKLMNLSTSELGAITHCQNAILSYKKLRNAAKVEELSKRFKQLKETLNLSEYKTEIDLTEHVKNCNKIANELVDKNTPEGIFQILILEKFILPQKEKLEDAVKENAKQNPLTHLIPATPFDQSGNPSESFGTQEEILYYHILHQYDLDLRFDKIHLINAIIYTAIRENKFSIHTLIDFLQKFSWIGKDLHKTLFNKRIQYNWLNLLAPSIHEYIVQIKNLTYNKYYMPNFILPIDSLTLKIEGLIRDFCHFGGVTTFYVTKDKNGNEITREKDIHSLLYENIMKDLFEEDDLLFFRFLLVEKAGYNLRHKVAHSLMYFENYSREIMNLLILCLLRISKYTFKEEPKL